MFNSANVVITGRNKNAVNRAAPEPGVTGTILDRGSLEQIDHLTAVTVATFGNVDLLSLQVPG